MPHDYRLYKSTNPHPFPHPEERSLSTVATWFAPSTGAEIKYVVACFACSRDYLHPAHNTSTIVSWWASLCRRQQFLRSGRKRNTTHLGKRIVKLLHRSGRP